MTTVISWNIQNGLGVDGKLSIKRISDTIRNMCNPDVICLQEVSVNVALPDGRHSDQVAELATEFDGYEPVFGVAMDVKYPGQSRRGQYGNLILSRFPVLSVFNHPLPQPAEGSKKQMPRQLTEATVKAVSGPLRVMTTHLEYHSKLQRLEQVKRIRDIESEVSAQEKKPPKFTDTGPYARFQRASKSVLCGDFNFLPDCEEYNVLTRPDDGQAKFHDAWMIANPGQAHAPTCGIFDDQQWPQGPHCRDFIFTSDDLAGSVENMYADTSTNASDHQPVVLDLNL